MNQQEISIQQTVNQYINLLFELRDNFKKTFVIVTHNPELMKLADVIFEIKDGIIKRTEN